MHLVGHFLVNVFLSFALFVSSFPVCCSLHYVFHYAENLPLMITVDIHVMFFHM